MEGTTIEVSHLTKRFGGFTAVHDLSFTVRPGRVTGFLGPNGAGKTTTLRCLLGLVTPTSGTATIGGTPYASIEQPLRSVGAALEAASFHPGRSARNHLRVLALASGIEPDRVQTVLDQVGLTEAADKRVGGFSLGMRQRLGLAAALLGDPSVLILDEPANGLDPAGIHWLRGFLRHLASEGRTVLISSHVLTEVQQTVDDVIVLARGREVLQGTLADLSGTTGTRVRAAMPERLRLALTDAGHRVTEEDGALIVEGVDSPVVGALAFASGLELHELTPLRTDLERAFLELTADGPAVAPAPTATTTEVSA